MLRIIIIIIIIIIVVVLVIKEYYFGTNFVFRKYVWRRLTSNACIVPMLHTLSKEPVLHAIRVNICSRYPRTTFHVPTSNYALCVNIFAICLPTRYDMHSSNCVCVMYKWICDISPYQLELCIRRKDDFRYHAAAVLLLYILQIKK
jgi:hypothetical protein